MCVKIKFLNGYTYVGKQGESMASASNSSSESVKFDSSSIIPQQVHKVNRYHNCEKNYKWAQSFLVL